MEHLNVLIHIDENEKWKVVLGNISNLLDDVGEKVTDVIVLANGYAVYGYSDPEKVSSMEQLAARGVKFFACRNSLNNMCREGVACLKEEIMPSFITIVPVGITELIKRQNNGYAYIKP
ncbi:MAG TPA: DsrE family protein [Dissulfurispiraceae bacterium]|nr:DsrE family protein [Dissulfurispiraceae bacterium]